MNIMEFTRLINGSIEYKMNNGALTLTGYRSGKTITLDLKRITEEMLEELIVDDEE